ncbi:MAG: malonyl-ACP O-methyltransferase BioC [Candidatus Margulisbacteria bacterium]|jgi:malonyl-CoA O-methyltransferase|nr:malonyl-ACP O-methyltransferase BioC [Candidatus Margulisiibacteriota bacterium]
MPDKRRVQAAFSRAAPDYDRCAVWQRQTAVRLLTRLKTAPANALDLGCGTGVVAGLLAARCPHCALVGLDLAPGMIAQAQLKFWQNADIVFQVGDMEHIPYPDESFELIVSNLALQWLDEPRRVFAEVFRALKPGGVFLFSTLAAGSLRELRQAYALAGGTAGLHKFQPAGELQRALLGQGLLPEIFTAALEVQWFADLRALLRSMQSVGAKSAAPGAMTKTRWQKLQQVYPRQDGRYPLTYEVVFASAEKLPMVEKTEL